MCDILDVAQGPAQAPIRAEIFGPERFAQHGRSLGDTHRAARAAHSAATFFPRLRSNVQALRAAHRYIGAQAATGYDLSPAAEWLLDNFHLIEAQLDAVHEGLPRRYFRGLPVLLDEPLAGLPRVYGVAWAFVAHTDGAFDDGLLVDFLAAYQDRRELQLSELWALPTTLRVVLIENLRRLAERVATHKAAREAANLCCDRIETFNVAALDQLLAHMNQRGVGRMFLAQMALRLQDLGVGAGQRASPAQAEWLQQALPDLAATRTQQSADQAADNLSVSNAVTSLRAIGDADWNDLVARTSPLMRLMLTSPVFEAEHAMTRDQTLHAIERLARRSRRSEVAVGRTLLDLLDGAETRHPEAAVAGYWLRDAGRPTLLRALGLHEPLWLRLGHSLRAAVLPAYMVALMLGTAALLALLLHPLVAAHLPLWLRSLIGVALFFPAGEAVVAGVNRLISESLRPQHLPRLALAQGIPPAHRVLVVIPAMLLNSAAISQLARRLELHHLANPEDEAQFALLSDWADCDDAHHPDDQPLLADATGLLRALNARYPRAQAGQAPRFLLLHRQREFSRTEQRWIGWERKRGKLEDLVAVLAQGEPSAMPKSPFIDLGDLSQLSPHTPYLLTLDSDTQLPPGRLRELVGVAAHPRNQPRVEAGQGRVTSGYGILQPRIVTPLPGQREHTLFHWLFAGQCGIDPYSAASSEVYQDGFGEGTFTGKGLLHVQALHAVLHRRLPEGLVLSHDLLEGSLARCAAVTDITLIEDAPFHADVAASRVHRWTRGDWQLLPFLLHPGRWRLRAINRWKLLDNLRRSLVPPMALVVLLLALAGVGVTPLVALALVLAAFAAGPLMGAAAGFMPGRSDRARWHFYHQALTDLARALCGGLWHLVQLPLQARRAVDAIARALWRQAISQRHLLQWTTAEAAHAAASHTLAAITRQHWPEPLMAALIFAGLWWQGLPHPVWSTALCALWAASPLWTWWVSRPCNRQPDALPEADQVLLRALARDTWRLFERSVGPDDRHLPPDNLQTLPQDMLAHRTSPTNIGLYLLSVACAREFGWIGTQDLITRLHATLGTLATLPRHRGHFLNWIDTQTGQALLPMYVSTVDSGNLCGHLLAVAQACLALARSADIPADSRQATHRALHAARQRLTPQLPHWPTLLPELQGDAALARLLALPDPLDEDERAPDVLEALLQQAQQELAELEALELPPTGPTPPTPRQHLRWCLGDYVATAASGWRDLQATAALGADATTRRHLHELAAQCEALAWAADFSFLYHPHRHLFHIGYRVAEQQLDAGFYDLLASESRLTSLLAIAKGDVPVRHWASLGRPFFAVGAEAGLRSWSGSMFEYLMPTLVLDEPQGSVLRHACSAALHEQIAYAGALDVPWGISESAYAGRDHTLAYQYAPQGVPRLALRRSPPDELVIAPYATALAAMIAPHRACLNFKALARRGARGRYGCIEALDFTPARQTEGELCTPVHTFMAHHQGMTLVALANVLLDGPAQRWGMANAHIAAVASLLHERAPREVSRLAALPSGPPLPVRPRRGPGLLREVLPGLTAIEPTHLLSNGRYKVSLRANGAGWSRWGQSDITRWRDDALRDAHGSFFYLRWAGQPRPVSITQHPAPDAAAHYRSIYHADRVCFDATWSEVQAHTTVWVSPEDDIEFRQVVLHNHSDEPLEIELISAFDITLADARGDEAHPAFSNLFVRAEWQPGAQALVFERQPRLPTEPALRAAHFLADHDPQITGLRVQTDRQRWLGRNQAVCRPLADLDDAPAVSTSTDRQPAVPLHTGLDPVCALAVRLRIAPGGQAQLTFATAASDNDAVLRAVVDKYRQPSHVQRASLMSATLTGIRLHALRISAENFATVQTLTTALVLSLSRPRPAASTLVGPQACDRRLLWRFGLSGDRPVILVTAGVQQGLGLLRSLAQALRLWSWGGVAVDVVVVNAEPASYLMALHRDIAALCERHAAENAALPGPVPTGFILLRADELSAETLASLHRLARLHLHADGRPLAYPVQAWVAQHEQALVLRQEAALTVLPVAAARAGVPVPSGTFSAASGEFQFDAGQAARPARPWINVLANPGFGTHLSEAGSGCTWAGNSRLHQLTAWSNDAVADPPAEWFLLQDLKTDAAWSVAPSAWGDEAITYRITHGQGYSRIQHRRGDLEVTVTWCVDVDTAVKQIHLRLVNHGPRTQLLRLVGLAEWMMGSQRSDRGTTHTAVHRQRLPQSKLLSLLCTQDEHSTGFGNATAFLALVGPPEEAEDWTCDRRECFDARGRLLLPEQFGRSSGTGLDPCAALATRLQLLPDEAVERVFLLGHAASPEAACALATRATTVSAAHRLARVRQHWGELLGACTVSTPDPLFDVMVNRWLLYQTVACRLWAKAGFYQAGGATGYRDQLQDSMALSWAAPGLLREQILLCASRQFAEGDVQHWWHLPTGAGVRTHFSDDLLWLPHACVHYLRATDDATLLDEPVPFLEGATIPEGAEDVYDTPRPGNDLATVYEHAARTLDRSLRVGLHGLPLMGTGDWNDGMNRVGAQGRGESVWLGWFLCRLVADFAPIAQLRGDTDRADRWLQAAQGWQDALLAAWDGAWFTRAYFDDGSALGSHLNAEARIDLIAQAWAVLSQAAPPELQTQAMAAVSEHLVDARAGLIRLLDPPLVHAVPSAGYIQAYPPGVRENGGQYNHAGVWALMAQAALVVNEGEGVGEGSATPYRWFTWLSPAHRSRHPSQGPAYGLEPYVMAGDVYSQPPYVGRGGWSWYTGSAAWMHRAAVESILGLQLQARSLLLQPCLPPHWPQAELTLRREGRSLHFLVCRLLPHEAEARAQAMHAQVLQPGEPLDWLNLPIHSHFVVPVPPVADTGVAKAVQHPSGTAQPQPSGAVD